MEIYRKVNFYKALNVQNYFTIERNNQRNTEKSDLVSVDDSKW